MKFLNRFIALLIVLSMMVSITGCGSNKEAALVEETVSVTAPVDTVAEMPVPETTVEAVTTTERPVPEVTTSEDVMPSPSVEETTMSVESTAEESLPIQTVEQETISLQTDPVMVEEPKTTVASTQAVTEDTSLDDELSELYEMDTDELTPTQRNAINMLNYMTVLTQEINDSTESRMFLDSADSELYNNIYPNAVDTKTQSQITSMLTTIHRYQMISVKRDRLEYIYEQNQAQALREAIPNPVGLLSAVQSKNLLKAAASVIYMAVDSATSYQTASTQAELQYLQSGWELDDEEADEIQSSRVNALNYMFNMVRDNSIPGDYALNTEAVQNFVSWKNNSNLVRKIAWFENNQSTYEAFGPYWLELAKDYYESGEYEKCLDAFEEYETVSTRIFRKDYDYAEALPMAIIAAKETMRTKDYLAFADEYTKVILNNTNDSDWALRYFVAQIYLNLYAQSKDSSYIDEAYDIALANVNVLVDEQTDLNDAYIKDVQKVSVDKDATKQQKEDVKQYNKLLDAERKVALPPVSEALYLNCDLLFALAEERGITTKEKNQIDSILHENGGNLFLATALDDRFRFSGGSGFDAGDIAVEFDGATIKIPASCVTDRSVITVTVTGTNGTTVFSDWIIAKVERPKNADCSGFIATFNSELADDYKFSAGETVTITVVPVAESPDDVIEFKYDVVAVKKVLVFNGIAFERE